MTFTAPAAIGMPVDEVETPCLLLDLDAFERNVETMGRFVARQGVRLRAHAKTHKSSDIALIQMEKGGACGICCQKVGEAEALVSAGVRDVMVSNQVVAPRKIERLAALAKRARVLVCVDDAANIDDLSAAAQATGSRIEVLVEIDVGAKRCGVAPGAPAAALAAKVAAAPGLAFAGLQAYQGSAQHVPDLAARKALIDAAVTDVKATLALLEADGLACDIVSGAGTGTYRFEGESGVYNELQCGSYVFMDAHYGRVIGGSAGDFAHSLFVYTSIMSKAKADRAICDAGLKAHSVDSGMPLVLGRDDLAYLGASDEHGVIDDPGDTLKLNDKLMLIPGHCDPTVNLHDLYICVRGGRVEALWPVTARGMGI